MRFIDHWKVLNVRNVRKSWTHRMIVEVQNASKEKTKDKTCSTNSHAIVLRERVSNRFQRVSIRHQLVNNIVHDFDYEFESRFLEMKNDQNQEKKNERLKSNIFFEFSSTSRRIESKNSMISFRDKSSWANNAIMNSKNVKKTLHRNSMSRFKFASKSFVNVNASIVINQMIDFVFLWKT
jgi:hypothetical protein